TGRRLRCHLRAIGSIGKDNVGAFPALSRPFQVALPGVSRRLLATAVSFTVKRQYINIRMQRQRLANRMTEPRQYVEDTPGYARFPAPTGSR
ncbi:hypothetical protein ACVBEG_26965, partial [Pseudomonas sp. GG8]